jgi:hypothetical protein
MDFLFRKNPSSILPTELINETDSFFWILVRKGMEVDIETATFEIRPTSDYEKRQLKTLIKVPNHTIDEPFGELTSKDRKIVDSDEYTTNVYEYFKNKDSDYPNIKESYFVCSKENTAEQYMMLKKYKESLELWKARALGKKGGKKSKRRRTRSKSTYKKSYNKRRVKRRTKSTFRKS